MLNVGIVWATNVWKSTLFNRLIGQFRAIVTDVHGTTQDILTHEYKHKKYWVITFSDSPGMHSFEDERPFIKKLLDNSDVLFFVLDSKVGLTAKEHSIQQYIQQNDLAHKTILIVNKLDKPLTDDEYQTELSEYYAMGYYNTVGVSAKTRRNVGLIRPMLETVIAEQLEKKQDEEEIIAKKFKGTSLAIVGRPNAGKSTLMNTLAKDVISKVEDVAGTTLDYVTSVVEYGGVKYQMFDTAGIRRKSKIHWLEKIAYEKTFGMLKFLRPIVVYLLDITEWLTHRDMTLLEEIHNKALPLLIAVNKTDTVDKKVYKEYIEKLSNRFQRARYIPILPLSGISWKGLWNLFKMITNIDKETKKKISTGQLNKLVTKEFIMRPPRFPKNKNCKIYYLLQTNENPPEFTVFINHKSRANFSFKRWLENSIRKHYGYVWVPLVFKYREREQKKHGENVKDYDDRVKEDQDKLELASKQKIEAENAARSVDAIPHEKQMATKEDLATPVEEVERTESVEVEKDAESKKKPISE